MNESYWVKWMKDHHIYIPTPEEAEEAKKNSNVKVHPKNGKNKKSKASHQELTL